MKLLQQKGKIWSKGDHENVKFVGYILDELQLLMCYYMDDTRYV